MKENWTRKSWSNCVKNRLRQNQLDPRVYFCRHTFSLSLLLSIVLLTRASSSSPNNCSLTETVSYLSRDAQDACTIIAPMQSHTRVSWGSAVIGRRNSCWGLSLDEAWGGRSDSRNEERGRKSATKIRRIEWTPNNELKRNRGKLEIILSVLILVVVAVMRQRTHAPILYFVCQAIFQILHQPTLYIWFILKLTYILIIMVGAVWTTSCINVSVRIHERFCLCSCILSQVDHYYWSQI